MRNYPVGRTVLVTTRSDKTFRGVLVRFGRRYLALRNAQLLRPHSDAVAVDGELLVMNGSVDFMQIVG